MAYKIYILKEGGKYSDGATSTKRTGDSEDVSDETRVVAYLPDEFGVNIEHGWENPFQTNTGAMSKAVVQWGSKKVGQGMKALGLGSGNTEISGFDPSAIANWAGIETFQYMGSSPIQLQFDLEFVVNYSVQEELLNPVKTLINLSAPSSNGTILRQPDRVSMYIPDLLYIDKAYISNVGINYMKPLIYEESTGKILPQRVRVPISIISAYLPTRERVNKAFFNRL